MAIDTQSIASLMVLSSTPVNVMIPPIASSIRVRSRKTLLLCTMSCCRFSAGGKVWILRI